MSDSLQPHGLQHGRPPWTSPTPRVLKPMSIESVMPSNHLILCRPLLLLPSTFPSIRVFSNESALRIRWPKDWSFSFNISPSNEYSGLISFRMDWLDLLAVQGTPKNLLQHHSSKASILRCSVFFIVQLSHPYTTTGKTIALTRQTFVGKVMSLLFNTLSRLVISFLPRSKHLLIREEPLISYCILRGTLTSLLQLKRNPEFTLAAREEDQLPDATQEEPWCPLLQLKKDKSIWTNLPSDFVYFLASDFVF